MIFLLRLGQEDGDKLVTPFADLTACLFKGHLMTEFHQCFVSGESMQIDRVDQRSVDIENGCFGHARSWTS